MTSRKLLHDKHCADREAHTNAVVESAAKNKVVAAGPGAGKTLLFKRICEKKRGSVLVLSFINELINDLKADLSQLAEVRTLHSFATKQLKADFFPKLTDVIQNDRPAACLNETPWRQLLSSLGKVGDQHVLIATHHPVVDVGCPWLDKDRLTNATELLECLSEHSSVKSLVFGHAHQTVDAHFRHIRLLGTPSTCFQFEPASLAFGIDDAAPGYRWLQLHADGGLTTEVGRAADFELNVDLSQRHK